MPRVRRSPFAFFCLDDALTLDPLSLLAGERPARTPGSRILALCILTGERTELTEAEFELLRSVAADEWVDAGGFDAGSLQALCAKGLLVSDAKDGVLTALRERDESLSAGAWNLYAALYHYMTQWSGVDAVDWADDADDLTARRGAAGHVHAALHGDAPEPFADVPAQRTLRLPGRSRDGRLYDVLTARRTTRAFAVERSITLEQLDTVLHYVFGCHGYTRSATGALCIKRTSPSAGGMHPTEVYPILSGVAGVDSGIYHYNGREHALGVVRELEPALARQLASASMCGQDYFGDAHISFVLTARFYRNHWKYRLHQKAYAALLMDAAHLSQTLYLVSAELGLGAFVTLAVNARDVERNLGLDGVSEGVIAMAGCGVRSEVPSALEPEFTPR